MTERDFLLVRRNLIRSKRTLLTTANYKKQQADTHAENKVGKREVFSSMRSSSRIHYHDKKNIVSHPFSPTSVSNFCVLCNNISNKNSQTGRINLPNKVSAQNNSRVSVNDVKHGTICVLHTHLPGQHCPTQRVAVR